MYYTANQIADTVSIPYSDINYTKSQHPENLKNVGYLDFHGFMQLMATNIYNYISIIVPKNTTLAVKKSLNYIFHMNHVMFDAAKLFIEFPRIKLKI